MRYWLSDVWDEWLGPVVGTIVIVAIVICLILAVVCGLSVWADPPACAAATADMSLPHRWSFWGGCQVQTPREGWIPLSNLIITLPARGSN